MNQYEAMFVFDPAFGSAFDKCEAEIRRLMERAQAEILFCRKWDERRLAYRIKKCKRGVYVLVYFKAPPDKIAPLERDAKLSEHILRLLVLRTDHMTREAMEEASRSSAAEPVKTGGEARKASKAGPDAGTPPHREAAPEVQVESVATETVVADRPPDDEAT